MSPTPNPIIVTSDPGDLSAAYLQGGAQQLIRFGLVFNLLASMRAAGYQPTTEQNLTITHSFDEVLASGLSWAQAPAEWLVGSDAGPINLSEATAGTWLNSFNAAPFGDKMRFTQRMIAISLMDQGINAVGTQVIQAMTAASTAIGGALTPAATASNGLAASRPKAAKTARQQHAETEVTTASTAAVAEDAPAGKPVSARKKARALASATSPPVAAAAQPAARASGAARGPGKRGPNKKTLAMQAASHG